jgi:phosphatidylserine/phosphatidylglycerophosphate/cardiolipin synthase-like enzyme
MAYINNLKIIGHTMLIDGEQYRKQLEKGLIESTRFICYSAFFTKPAADWLIKHRIPLASDRLLVRALPIDFVSGACSFDAIKKIISFGISIKMSSALHAKIFAFDKCIYAGSANLTAKGLALCVAHNQELGVRSVIEDEDLSLLDHLWSEAITIDSETLNKMEDFVDSFSKSHSDALTAPLIWPPEIASENRDMYCSDFPQSYTSDDFRWSTEKNLKQSKAYKWLENIVKEHGEVRFGFLSKQLHNAVYDDPIPYRKEIKNLLANLLSCVSALDKSTLEIIRPNHSQIVRMRQPN